MKIDKNEYLTINGQKYFRLILDVDLREIKRGTKGGFIHESCIDEIKITNSFLDNSVILENDCKNVIINNSIISNCIFSITNSEINHSQFMNTEFLKVDMLLTEKVTIEDSSFNNSKDIGVFNCAFINLNIKNSENVFIDSENKNLENVIIESLKNISYIHNSDNIIISPNKAKDE